MGTPIRILHMIAILEMGGSQSMIMNLYRAIDRNKIQFDFIVDHPDRNTELRNEIKSLGGNIFSFPTFRGKNLYEIRKTWDRFFKEHPEYKVLHTHSRSYASIYLPIAKRHGLVTISHSHSTSNGKGMSAKIKDLLQLPIRHQADYMFACSREAGKWLFGKRAVKSSRFKVIPNSIDSHLFIYNQERREQVRKELGIRDSFIVGHVGRLSKPKNHSFLLKCFKELNSHHKDSILLLVGDGELGNEIKNEAKRLKIEKSVIFTGSQINTYDYYQAMDCFVFPSLWEGFGIAVVEAQASGLHCIVSDRVPPDVDIGAHLITFLSIDDIVQKWEGEMSKKYDRKNTAEYVIKAGFDITQNAVKMQKFYEELVK